MVCQYIECTISLFTIADGVFGSVFYLKKTQGRYFYIFLFLGVIYMIII